MNGASMLKAAGLWERISARGKRYFAGRLGGVKVLILENRDRTGEDEPSHFLFFVDGEKRAVEAGSGRSPQRDGVHATRRNISRRTDGAPFGELPNDHLEDLWPALDGGDAP